jgi:hypothetical protein
MYDLRIKTVPFIPPLIRELYRKRFHPDQFIMLDATANYESKMKFIQKNQKHFLDPSFVWDNREIANIWEWDEILGPMPMPDPASISSHENQKQIFASIISSKDVAQFEDPFGNQYKFISPWDFPRSEFPHINLNPADDLIDAYRTKFYEAFHSLSTAGIDPENDKAFVPKILKDTLDPALTDTSLGSYWAELGSQMGTIYWHWHQLFQSEQLINHLYKIYEAQPSKATEQSPTRRIILDAFATMGSKGVYGWQYAFRNESHYNQLVLLLEQHFTNEQVTLPLTPIPTRPNTKTQLANTLKEIYDKKGEISLRRDNQFISIVKSLEAFSDNSVNDIYKSLTR